MTLRLDLEAIHGAQLCLEREWPRIDAQLRQLRIGSRSTFNSAVRGNLLGAYAYLDELLTRDVEPFSDVGMEHMLSLNQRVLCGDDATFAAEFA